MNNAGSRATLGASGWVVPPIVAENLPALGKYKSIALFGDSITAQNYYRDTTGGANSCYFADNGYLNWGQALAGVDFDFVVDAGIGGDTTTQMLARVRSDDIAYSPQVCIVMGGVNDFVAGATVSTVYSNLVAIYEVMRSAGIFVIAASPPPRSSSTAAIYRALAALRNKIEDYCNQASGMLFWDAYTAGVDATNSTSNYKTNYSADGTHPNNLGAYYLGSSLSSILSTLFPAKKLASSQSEVKASNSDSNQLIANPLMVGSASAVGTGTSGTKPTNWNVLTPSNQAGGAATAYTAGGSANGGVGYKAAMACTGAAAAVSTHYFYSDDFSSSLVDGNALQAAARIKVTAASGLLGVYLKITRNAGSGKATNVYWNYKASGAQSLPTFEALAAMTPAMTFVAGGTINLWLQVDLAAGGSATIEIEQAEVRDLGTSVGLIDNDLSQ